MYKNFIKPIADFFFALVLLFAFLPVFCILILILSIHFKGSPFFKQKRPGLNGEVFTLIKFKTMHDLTDESGRLLPDEQRLSGVGKFIRKYSLDELPQLFNILFGHISFVGPRPLLLKYMALYNEEQKKRHNVKPGITGWAQVNGRNNIEWGKRFELDVWYVDHQSFLLDLKIIMKTVLLVFRAENINKEGFATMDEFKGN